MDKNIPPGTEKGIAFLPPPDAPQIEENSEEEESEDGKTNESEDNE